MEEFIVKITPEEAGRRLDVFVLEFLRGKNPGISRTFVQKLLKEKRITIKNLISLKPHYKIKPGDEIRVLIEKKKEPAIEPENIPLGIIYEDTDLAIINKPAGLVTHPAPGNYEHTLVNALRYHFSDLSDINPQKPGIVHRLDKDTSGLLVIAKNNAAHLGLAQQFARHTIKRKYVALVKGRVEFKEHVIEMPIGRHPRRRKNMSVGFGKKAKYAKTYYKTMARTDTFSFLELYPYTGRTHQLRVHLAFIGHPILGDAKYSRNNDFIRLALHAQSLGFVHPRTGKFMEFSCDIPPEFAELISKGGCGK